MAKSSLPRIDGSEPQQQTRREPPAAAEEQAIAERISYSRTLRHASAISVKRMSMQHRKQFCEIIRSLQDRGASLADGTPVTDKTKAFLWMLENHVR
jgi:hypothetical protein